MLCDSICDTWAADVVVHTYQAMWPEALAGELGAWAGMPACLFLSLGTWGSCTRAGCEAGGSLLLLQVFWCREGRRALYEGVQ
jgi:hypothetical protein